MHRILLFALVLVLACLARDTRRQVRPPAASPFTGISGVDSTLAGVGIDPVTHTPYGGRLFGRFEARVQLQVDGSAIPAGEPGEGAEAEAVLAQAERWVESRFPEGGRTAYEPPLVDAAPAIGPIDTLGASNGRNGSSDRSGGLPLAPEHSTMVYFASLARLESLEGDPSAWYGWLDLALIPSGSGFDTLPGTIDPTQGETAWISDDQGRLLMQVEALNGIGMQFDPSWPWVGSPSPLKWTTGAASELPLRQYRLLFQGSGYGPSWSGRLVLRRRPPPPPPEVPSQH